MRASFSALSADSGRSGWRPTRALTHRQRDYRDYRDYRDHPGAFVRQPPPHWLRACANERWRRFPRLPLCLADSTFVVDNIRCQHSPPEFAAHYRDVSIVSALEPQHTRIVIVVPE